MKYRETTNKINKKYIFNTSRIYFEICKIDTFSTKFVNIDANDYTRLEKAYTKNISIKVKCLDKESKQSIDVGIIDLTCFDINEAAVDNINMKEVLDAEGINTLNIYSVVIDNFNKDYYNYFGYTDERNIANITNISLNEGFKEKEIIRYILKNINKIVYHLLGLKISTILSLKKLNCLNYSEDIMDIYTNLGFLEVDNENNFVAKNIDINKTDKQRLIIDELPTTQVLITEFNKIIEDKKVLQDILNREKQNTRIIDDLNIFENREYVGNKLLEFIRGEGYTKSSFAKMLNIKKETLNKILNGSISDKNSYLQTLNKILKGIEVELEVILEYKNNYVEKTIPKNLSLNEEILEGILDLYEIYELSNK